MLGLNTLTLISSRIGSVIKSIIKDQLISNIPFLQKTQTSSSLNYVDEADSSNGEAQTGVAYSFDGVNDYGQFVGTTQDFRTVAFTIKARVSQTYKTVMQLGNQFMAGLRDVKLTTGGSISILNAADVTIYIDGALQSSTNKVGVGSFHRVVMVFDNDKESYNNGPYYIGGNGVSAFAPVDICNVQMYSEPFTTADILYDYNNPDKLAIDNPSTSLESSDLNFWWAMTEYTGSTLYNSSTSTGNNITLSGGSWVRGLSGKGLIQVASMDRAFNRSSSTQPLIKPIILPATVKSSVNHSDRRNNVDALSRSIVSSDGNFMGYGGDCTFLSSKYYAGYNNFSLSVWVKYDYVRYNSSYNAIAIIGDDSGFDLSIISTGSSSSKNGFEVRGITGLSMNYNSNLVIGEWYNLTLVRVSTTIYKFYVDGVDVATDTSTYATNIGTKNKLTIGRDFNVGSTVYERFYSDMIGDVLFYDKALEADEVLNNFNITKGNYGK